MFFRIQTLYLILASVFSGILSFIFPFHILNDIPIEITKQYEYLILFLISTLLSVVSIFQYKKRQTQFILDRLNMILNIILLGLFFYRSLNISGEYYNSEKGIGFLLPVFTIVFLVFANKAIKKDEELVKSVDRLR